jgi:hypothetical protein
MYNKIISPLNSIFRHGLSESSKRQMTKPHPVFPDDTFFVSYPRSGSAWLRRLVGIALHPESPEKIRRNINEVIPDMYAVGEQLAQYARPRMIKSHESYQPLYPKVVYLYRDARDVALSYYNFYQTIKGYEGTLDDFLGLFLNGNVDFGRWDHHIRSWLFRGPSESLFAVSYEELSRDTRATLASVLAFLGHSVSGKAIEKAVEECTFGRHQVLVKDLSPHYSGGYRGGVAGRPGRGRETLSERQLAVLWDAVGATLESLAYRH